MDSPPSPTYPRNVSYTSEYTEARSNPHSFSDAFGNRPNSQVEDQQQRTLKGHTDEQKQAPDIIDAAGVRVTSYHDEPGYFNRRLGQDSVNYQERARPLSQGDLAGNRPKSKYDDSTYVHVEPPPSLGKVRELNPSYEDNDDDDEDEDDCQRPPPMTFNGDHYGRH